MVKLFYLIFSIIFASLFGFKDEKINPYKRNQALMANIIDISIDQLSKRYSLIPIGTGGGEKEGKSWLKCVSFQLYKKITKEEARILIIEVVEFFYTILMETKKLYHIFMIILSIINILNSEYSF